MNETKDNQEKKQAAKIFQVVSDKHIGYLMIAPAMLIIFSIAFYPVLQVLYTSFFKERVIFGIHEFVGFRNYYRLFFEDSRFWASLWNTIYFTVLSVSFEFLLGLLIALQLNAAFRGRGLVRTAILIPWAIPTVISAKMWEFIFNSNYGIFNYLLLSIGDFAGRFGIEVFNEPINWTGNKFYAIHAAIISDVWKTTPFVALLLLAGLVIIPQDLYKAAKVDGASRWIQFKEITIPLLMPTIMVTLLFRTLDAFRAFDLIYVLTGGGPANTTETLSIYAYKVLFELSLTGYGSALSVIIFFCVMLISYGYIRILSRGEQK